MPWHETHHAWVRPVPAHPEEKDDTLSDVVLDSYWTTALEKAPASIPAHLEEEKTNDALSDVVLDPC